MGLFDPIWKTKNEKKVDKAIEAVQKITDQSKLIEIARTAPIGRVQHAAVWKISDPEILCDIILSADPAVSAEAKDAACYQFTDAKYAFDQKYLLKIAQNSGRFGIRAAAKITDQALLRQLALSEAKNEEVKSDAVLNITDHKVLAEIAEHARPPENAEERCIYDARKTAVDRLKDLCRKNYSTEDYRLIRHIAAEAEDPKIRKAAEEVLADLPEEITKEEALPKSEPSIMPDRKEITEALFASLDDIKGISKLRQIYLTDKREERRVQAFRDIIFNQAFPQDRLAAAYKITRQEASVPGCSYLWGETRNLIENFIEKRKADDPAFLLGIIKDPECGANLCASCLRVLFWHQYPDVQENIEALRDKAVRTYIDNIPAYRPGLKGKEYCIRQLALAIPEKYHERYGFTVKHYVYEDEDQFGRNTATATEISFNGQTYIF